MFPKHILWFLQLGLVVPDKYLILPSFTEFYRVLPSFQCVPEVHSLASLT